MKRTAPQSRPAFATFSARAFLAVAFLAVAAAGPAVSQTPPPETRPIVVMFDALAEGSVPPGFRIAMTGGGLPPRWVVRADATAPAGRNILAQTAADRTEYRYPHAVLEAVNARDVDVSVRFRNVSGSVDRAAGIIARWRDANNYYVLRANAAERNVYLYVVDGGRRRAVMGRNVAVSGDRWHSLRLIAIDDGFVAMFDDQRVFEARDTTFPTAGAVGLWTKADSVTHFDDFAIRIVPR